MGLHRSYEALDQLVRSELLFCRGEIPHAVYTFKHALVRNASWQTGKKSPRASVTPLLRRRPSRTWG